MQHVDHFFVIAASLLFGGVYTAIDIALPNSGQIPMASAAPGLFVMLLRARLDWAHLTKFVLIPSLVVAGFSLVAPSLSIFFINRVLSVAQVAYGMLIGYVCCWSLQRIGVKRLQRILHWLVPAYLTGLALEALLEPIQNLIREYQELVYPAAVDLGSIIGREAGMGGYRPKFFTSETSFVAITVLLLITADLWCGKDSSRYYRALALTVVAFILVRSPIVVLLLPIIFATAITDQRLRQFRGLLGMSLAAGAALAFAGAYAVIGDVVNTRISNAVSGQDYSTTFRTYGSLAVAGAVIEKYPLFGVGPGGIELAKNEVISTELALGVPENAVKNTWKTSIANAPAAILIYFGMIGFIFLNWVVFFAIHREIARPQLPVFVAILIWGLCYAAIYSPKFIITTLVIFGIAKVRDQLKATPAYARRRPGLQSTRPQAGLHRPSTGSRVPAPLHATLRPDTRSKLPGPSAAGNPGV